MGKQLLARLVDGIKARLGKNEEEQPAAAAAGACSYDKVDRTESMRVEIRSRHAQGLIAKNLAAADSIGRRTRKKSKKRFFAF